MKEKSSRIIGTPASHEALHAWLESEVPGKILDIPAGHGDLALWLRERGWDVECSDIDRGNLDSLDDVPFEVADLNRKLPYEDERFDAVVCANGIHRLFNPKGAIGEFARIIKHGGRLYINVNNYSSIACRVRFLFYGSVAHRFDREYYCQTIDDPEANVRIPIVYSQIASYLHQFGFKVTGVRPADVGRRDKALKPVGWCIKLLSMIFAPRSAHKDIILDNTSSAVLTGGRYLLIVAEKA